MSLAPSTNNSIAVGLVMSNWNHIIKSVSLASSKLRLSLPLEATRTNTTTSESDELFRTGLRE